MEQNTTPMRYKMNLTVDLNNVQLINVYRGDYVAFKLTPYLQSTKHSSKASFHNRYYYDKFCGILLDFFFGLLRLESLIFPSAEFVNGIRNGATLIVVLQFLTTQTQKPLKHIFSLALRILRMGQISEIGGFYALALSEKGKSSIGDSR
ncbi:uncharacterized protein KY384_005664 [Bacidia gigantensis]|uniref:uncharacterized protein n=1 Tax=Bacidia gigantensis TaxID=2732470 RepID=UPI001D05B626|nr:uncharacterized protein KY384_005664 [Bacidia gigantensis]KAG8530181.1 hypothetical protein KY384_005664 [Bacidia gigantensis]